MNLLLKKFLVIVAALLIAIPVASAILALLLGMTIQEGFIFLILIVGSIAYFCYGQHQKAENMENLRANQIDQLVKRAAYQALSTGAWGAQLQIVSTLQQMRYYSAYIPQTKCLNIKIEMATKNRAPLLQTQQAILQQAQKDILRQAIAADLGQVLSQPGLMVKGFNVYPIYTASTYEIADVEVQL